MVNDAGFRWFQLIVAVAVAQAVVGCGGDADDAADDAGAAVDEDCGLPDDAGACGACTGQGAVVGLPEGDGGDSCAYLGLPFAQPPVGELRWASPIASQPWEGVRDATVDAAACPQGQAILGGEGAFDEDCLYLNVHAPAVPGSEPLPVMVFVHGGGYNAGTARTFSGLGLSEGGPAVLVIIQYRLGPLGFLSHPALDATREDVSGSDGMRDQQLALQWVQDNIAAFGGDPNNVTVFGESAGSSAVNVHLVSPRSEGLAHRFIMESGAAIGGVSNGIEPISVAAAHAIGEQMASELCPDATDATDVLACLRAVAADTLMAWTSTDIDVNWVPVIDGEGGVLPEHPDVLMASGAFNPGEIIIGTNRNEHGLFALTGDSSSADAAEFTSFLELEFADDVDALRALYLPDGSDAAAPDAHIALMTDIRFRCVSRRLARRAADMGRDVYLYSFEQGSAWHGDELAYVFGEPNYKIAIAKLALGVVDPELTATMQGYWLQFARAGDPNADGLPSWPRYSAQTDEHMVLRPSSQADSGLQTAQCDFWDAYLER